MCDTAVGVRPPGVRQRYWRARNRPPALALAAVLFLAVPALGSEEEEAPPIPAQPAASVPTGPARGDGDESVLPAVGAIRCVGCAADVELILARYSTPQWEALGTGEIRINSAREEGELSLGRVQAEGLIEHSPERVWSVLTDFDHWADFVPLISQARILRSEGPLSWVRMNYRVLAMNLSHTTIYEFAPEEGRLSWRLDLESDHDIAGTEGRWLLLPIDTGSRTLVHYQSAVDAGRALPGFVERMLAGRSLRRMIKSLRTETGRRYGAPAQADD